jgi:hypothetical protein
MAIIVKLFAAGIAAGIHVLRITAAADMIAADIAAHDIAAQEWVEPGAVVHDIAVFFPSLEQHHN